MTVRYGLGFLVPQSGVYSALGDDMKNAFELYVDQNDGELGGREVEIILADEGETADSGQAAATKLIKSDEVVAIPGVVSSAVVNSIRDMVEGDGVPLVGSNASPTDLVDVEYIWRTSYVNDQPGIALGEYVAENVDGPVYLVAADYQAGVDEIEGFKETFIRAGGEVADEVYTPFPDTTNFQLYLAQIQASDAAAVFTFYAGGAAVDFVKPYDDFGLAGDLPRRVASLARRRSSSGAGSRRTPNPGRGSPRWAAWAISPAFLRRRRPPAHRRPAISAQESR